MLKKLFSVSIFLLVFSFFSTVSIAQALNVGYIDINRVFDDYEKTKVENKILEELSNEKQQERDKIVNQIQEMREKMKIMSEKGKDKQRLALEEKVSELQNFDRKARNELTMKRDEIMKDILEEIQSTVKKYAKDKKFDLIFYRNALLYHNESLDITSEIIDILNSKYKR